MNFLERTFSSASTRPGAPTPLIFERVKADPVTHSPVKQRLSISFSATHGQPSIQDDEVYVGLLAITHQRNQEGRDLSQIEFTRYELIQAIGWSDCGRSYNNIDRAINRLGGVWVVSDNAFYDREAKSWVDTKFHIINESHLFTREKYDRAREVTRQRPKSWIQWGGPLLKSIRDGNLATFDLATYCSIKSGVAKKLYRYSNKRLHNKPKYIIDIRELAEEKLGFKSGQAISELSRKLEPSFAELASFGLHSQLNGKSSTVTFSKRKRKTTMAPTTEPVGLEKALIDRGVDRVGKKSAAKLVAKQPAKSIQEQIENYDDRLAHGEKLTVGWLIAAIVSESGFGFRKGFKSSAHRRAEAEAKCKKEAEREASARREKQQLAKQRRRDQESFAEFLELRNSFSEHEQISKEDEALKRCDKFIRDFLLKARRRGEVGLYHQMVWEQHIIPHLDDSRCKSLAHGN